MNVFVGDFLLRFEAGEKIRGLRSDRFAACAALRHRPPRPKRPVRPSSDAGRLANPPTRRRGRTAVGDVSASSLQDGAARSFVRDAERRRDGAAATGSSPWRDASRRCKARCAATRPALVVDGRRPRLPHDRPCGPGRGESVSLTSICARPISRAPKGGGPVAAGFAEARIDDVGVRDALLERFAPARCTRRDRSAACAPGRCAAGVFPRAAREASHRRRPPRRHRSTGSRTDNRLAHGQPARALTPRDLAV